MYHATQTTPFGTVSNQSRQIILATHSADVVRGILSRTSDVDIIRIDRTGNTNHFKHLNAQRLKTIINDPLLSSARVLDGLFYGGAVVVEADADAQFYQAASVKRSRALDLHFVNADNKQTVPTIVKLYRDIGVPAAGIVDSDVLNNRAELEKSLETLGFSKTEVAPLVANQDRIAQAIKELPARERLEDLRSKLTVIRAKVEEVAQQTFTSQDDEQRTKAAILRELESRFKEISDMTKAWKAVKQGGRLALPPEAQTAFDEIWSACAAPGVLHQPSGGIGVHAGGLRHQPDDGQEGLDHPGVETDRKP
jgi:hypothetical protein